MPTCTRGHRNNLSCNGQHKPESNKAKVLEIAKEYFVTSRGGSETFSLGVDQWEAMVLGWRAFSRNNYRSPTTNYAMQVFGSDA